jgi:adenylate kinase family enzyme
MKKVGKFVPFMMLALSLILNSFSSIESKEKIEKDSNGFKNHMEYIGIGHNEFLEKVYDKGLNSNSSIKELVMAGSPKDIEHLEFITKMVNSVGQPEVDKHGNMSIEVGEEIERFLDQNPVLWEFQNKMITIINEADGKPVEGLISNIKNLEFEYSKELEGVDLDAMLAVGSTARHSALFWSSKIQQKHGGRSHISRYIGRDFVAMWTVGIVSMFAGPIGVGAALAAGAVASILTDM